MTKCELTLTYIDGPTWKWGVCFESSYPKIGVGQI